MADIQAQISEARKAGYDDAAIAAHLTEMPEYGSKMKTALAAGYKPAEILSHLSASRQSKSLVDQIPGMLPVATPAPTPSLYQRVLGAAEVPFGMLGGIVSGVVAPIVGVAGALTSGQFGTPAGVRAGERAMLRTQDAIGYRPVTQPGAENIQAVGEVLAPLGGVPIPTLNALARTARAPLSLATNALRGEAQLVGGAVSERVKTRRAVKQVANEAKSYANAPQIEAAQTAQRLSLAVPPSISNPTKTTRAISAIAGREGDKALGEGNAKQIIKLVKDDIGDTSPDPISLATINNALDVASGPYAPVRALPALRVSDAATQTLNAIPKAPLIGGKAGAAAVRSLVDETLEALTAGRSGKMVLGDIRKLRSDAQAIFKANDRGTSAPDPVATESAKAKMKIANALEDIVDANAPPDVLPALKAARIKMAQINDHARALDYVSGVLDPQMYAKLLQERKGQMTGLPADIGKVAAIYPSVMTVTPATSFVGPRALRSTLGMGLGAALGTAVGVGPLVGAGAGSVGGAFAGNLAARRMASPAFQAKYAMPRDYRPANVNAPEGAANTLPVPYISQGSVITAAEAPNWVYGRPDIAPPPVTVGIPQGPRQLAAPSSEATMTSVAQQRAYELARDRAAGVLADRAAAAQEPAGRVTTPGGTVYEFDPFTGKLRPAQQSGGGPVLRPERLGENVTSAVEKIASGRSFQLSAVEKIAWAKTKVDLASIEPGFNTLSDKAINGKIMDRQWVADAIAKARDKAAAFDDIAKRATDAQKTRAAAVSREKMLDLAELLGENLRARPVGKSSQGPKTRAAQRLNQLSPQESQNRLAAP